MGDLVAVNVRRIRQTRERAMEVFVVGAGGWLVLVWLPRSQIVGGSEYHGGEWDCELLLPRWLAETNRLAYRECQPNTP